MACPAPAYARMPGYLSLVLLMVMAIPASAASGTGQTAQQRAVVLGVAQQLVSSAAPPQAAAAGFNVQTFGPAVTLGTSWFDDNFYGRHTGPAIQTGSGSVIIDGALSHAISSARQDRSRPNAWRGTAFGGGGYFEAILSFSGADGSKLSSWPAFWANDIENMSQNAVTALTQWPGQAAGFGNWIEVDVMEFDHADIGQYGIQVHNWYGHYGQGLDVRGFGPGVQVPAGFDWSLPHRYGVLWVPASAATRGYLQMYLDGVAIGPRLQWNSLTPSAVPPPSPGSTAFAVLDQRHLALILSTGPHNPMTVYAVSAWQNSAAGNLVQ